jgi:hypothetical protein
LTAPDGLPDGGHVWLRVPTEQGDLWLDFLAVAAFEVSFDGPTEAYLEQGEPLPARLQVLNRRAAEARPRLQFTGEGLACEPAETDLTIPAGTRTSATVNVALPFQNGDYTLTAQAAEGDLQAAARLSFRAEVVRAPVLDLTNPEVRYVRGRCRRGGEEVLGREVVEDGSFEPTTASSGSVSKRCLFSHPPFNARGPGYSFAIYDLTLPDEPATFNVSLGLRDGLDPSDGVTFIVQVIDAAGETHELFRRHYAEVRWQGCSVDLGPFQGQKVRLKLLADCGPADNTIADHGLWGEAQVVLQREKLRVRCEAER